MRGPSHLPDGKRRSAVIGAGPAGCAAADRLARAGRDVVLFERAPAVGGRTTTWRDQHGAVVDSGAGFFTNFYPTLESLLPRLGLAERTSPLARENVLVADGRTIDFKLGSLRSFALHPLVGAAGKLRMTAYTALAVARFRHLEHANPDTLAAYDDRSIRDQALATVGEQAYHYLVRPGVEPFWYFSCAEVSRSLLFALQAKAPAARFFTMRDGMDTICSRLVDSGSLQVRTGRAVAAVEPGDGVELRVDGTAFDEVVVATTASVARTIVADALLTPAVRSFLASQRYVPNVHASFRLPRDACPGESARFPCGPGTFAVAALAFNSHKHQGALREDEEIVSVYLSAAESAPLADATDEAIFARAWTLARELCPTLPTQATPFRCVARREAIPIHEVGRYRQAAGVLRAQHGPLVFAGDFLATATVEGALSSGQRAAEVLLAAPRTEAP